MRRPAYKAKAEYMIKRTATALTAVILACQIMTAGPVSIGLMPSYVYAAEEMTATGTVHNDKLNVRSGPSTEDDVIGQLEDGDEVDITGVDGDWYRIEYDEEVGYVASKYIEIKGEDSAEVSSDDESDESKEEDKEKEDKIEATDEDFKPSSEIDITTAAIIAAIILVLVIIIFATVKSIRNISDEDDYYEDDDYPDDEDYYPDDDYPDEEEDDYPEEDDGYEEDYEEDYEDAEEEYEDDRFRSGIREEEPVRPSAPLPPAMQAVRDGADPARYMSDNPEDYRIDIDPKYFEKTATLPDLTEVLEEDEDAPVPIGPAEKKPDEDAPVPPGNDKDAQLAAAYKKMEELREELERIKNEQA